MHTDYYQNTLYPLQDKVISIISQLPVDFYLTGGTALGRAFLHHRYSDDLDFFVNANPGFKHQVNLILEGLKASGFNFDMAAADDAFARIFIIDNGCSLKVDFVNDVPFRSGKTSGTGLFKNTDNMLNILSNKITALSRYAPKDVVDIVFICNKVSFRWENIFDDASQKDLWVNPVNAAEILDEFPVGKLGEIAWIIDTPTAGWFRDKLDHIIPDILTGGKNSLFKPSA